MKTRHAAILALLLVAPLFTLVGCDSAGETPVVNTPAPNEGSNNADTSGEDAKNSNNGEGKEATGKTPVADPISDPDSVGDGETPPVVDEPPTTPPAQNDGNAAPPVVDEPPTTPPAQPDPPTPPPVEPDPPAPPSPPARPEWTGDGPTPPDYATPTPGTGYEGGTVVFHNGKYYKSKQWTASEPTGDGDSAWERVRPNGQPWLQTGLANITAYDANLTYGGAGYYVTYNGGTYKSKHWTASAPAGCDGGNAWERWERIEKPDGSSEYKKYFRTGAANVKPWCATVEYPGAEYYVTYNGATYKSKWSVSANDTPGGDPWELVP